MQALKTLKKPVQHWDDWLVYITVKLLDSQSRRDWEASLEASLETSIKTPSFIASISVITSAFESTLRSMHFSSNGSKSKEDKKSFKDIKSHLS